MTHNDVNSAQTVNHISKEDLLELLSKKLGCPSEEVGFLFQGIDKTAAPQELTIPDGRALPYLTTQLQNGDKLSGDDYPLVWFSEN